ncbi:MAG: hypothetical protein AB8C13_06110 [Phycisphaerales bacterium]
MSMTGALNYTVASCRLLIYYLFCRLWNDLRADRNRSAAKNNPIQPVLGLCKVDDRIASVRVLHNFTTHRPVNGDQGTTGSPDQLADQLTPGNSPQHPTNPYAPQPFGSGSSSFF